MPMTPPVTDGPALGLDIGSRVVKMVLAGQIADRIEIQAAGSFALMPGIVENGIVRDTKGFAHALAAQLDANGIEAPGAVVSIPSVLAVLRWITLPPLAGEELREAVRYKVRRHLPFPVNSAYIEASVPNVHQSGETVQYLVIAVPREVIDSRAEAVEIAGLVPVAAELEAQAILRVVERRLSEQSPLWRDASLTIIDVGATYTHMYVVQNQMLQFLRGVKFGAELFSHAISTELSISRDQASALIGRPETELDGNGILHLVVDELPVRISVQAEMERLMRECLRLLRYFRSLHPERSYAGILDHVLLCGGMAGLHGFDEYLQSFLGLRVERARPFAGTTGKFNTESFESIARRQEAYTVVMGLALSGLRGRIENRGDSRARREFVWARGA